MLSQNAELRLPGGRAGIAELHARAAGHSCCSGRSARFLWRAQRKNSSSKSGAGFGEAIKKSVVVRNRSFRVDSRNSRPELVLICYCDASYRGIGAQLEMGKVVTLGFDESAESGKGRKKTETAVPLRPADTLVRNRMDPP